MIEQTPAGDEEKVTVEGYVMRFGEPDSKGNVFMPGSITFGPAFAVEESRIDDQGVRVITKFRLISIGMFRDKRKEAP